MTVRRFCACGGLGWVLYRRMVESDECAVIRCLDCEAFANDAEAIDAAEHAVRQLREIAREVLRGGTR